MFCAVILMVDQNYALPSIIKQTK